MALDVLKGFVPALLATIYVGHLAGVLAGGAAMLGHWRPLFLRFARGGKAVATCGGAFLGVAPIVGGIGAVVWVIVFAVCRYASVSRTSPACARAPRLASASAAAPLRREEPAHFIGDDGSGEALELELADGCDLERLADCRVDGLADERLTGLGGRAQP